MTPPTLAAPTLLATTRGVGETTFVGGLPDVVVAVFSFVTYLGDPWLLMASLGLLYLVADDVGVDRNRVAAVLAVGFGALALTFALKTFFALPRPPGATADGYGFPSGHALGSTAVWGAAATLFRVGTPRRRFGVAAAVVALVAASRVVIGVHYLVDVVVGVLVGVGFLLVALRVAPGLGASARRADVTAADAGRLFSLALGIAVVGLAVGLTADGVFALGATAGAWGAWRVLGDSLSRRRLSRRGATALSLLALPVVVAGLFLTDRVAAALPVVGVVGGLLVASLVAMPYLAGAAVAAVRT